MRQVSNNAAQAESAPMSDLPLPGQPAPLQRSLPGSAYRTAEAFDLDRRAIFSREWTCVAREEELPQRGDYRVVEIAGESIILVRGTEGAIHGHYNMCRHRGSRLCDPANDARWGVTLDAGVIGRTLIRCPYHGWSYALDGRLLAAPQLQDAPGFDKAAFGLHPVGVACWGGFVFVNLTSRDETGLAAVLDDASRRLRNYPLADLRTGQVIRYEVAANWKLILENYNECYHCPGVHPELCEIVPAFRERGGIDLDWEVGIPHRPGAATYTASGVTSRAPFPGLSEEEKLRHKGELIYPNLMLSVAMDHVAAFILWPIAADRTIIDCRFLFHPDEMARPDFDRADAVEFWDLVNRQDWAVCERVQAGIASRVHDHGYYSPLEDMSLDIRRYVADRYARSGEES
jgi:Rieske 2Fe-2S family protein